VGEQSIFYHIILQVYYESQIMFGCIWKKNINIWDWPYVFKCSSSTGSRNL